MQKASRVELIGFLTPGFSLITAHIRAFSPCTSRYVENVLQRSKPKADTRRREWYQFGPRGWEQF